MSAEPAQAAPNQRHGAEMGGFRPNKHTPKDGTDAVQLSWFAKPRTICSKAQLKAILDASREQQHLVFNFFDLSLPRFHAGEPTFPTFTRFASATFATAETMDYKVVQADRATGPHDAKYYMHYPVNISVRDGRNVPMHGLPPEGTLDSIGYPLFYKQQAAHVVKARSCAALYPLQASSPPGSAPGAIPTNSPLFRLLKVSRTADAEASRLLQQRANARKSDDNHTCLLLKAYLAYFDNIAAALAGVLPKKDPAVAAKAADTIIHASADIGWARKALQRPDDVVNVAGAPKGYQEFWAFCCFDSPPFFAAVESADGVCVTPFSSYRMQGMPMTCLCDINVNPTNKPPLFLARPNLILSHIESYVQRHGLQQQAMDALQIAMLWPCLWSAGATISLPRPLHAADWIGDMTSGKASAATPFQGLISSNPYLVLASSVAGAWAMKSQLYDFVTLITYDPDNHLTTTDHDYAAAWLNEATAAPGAAWDFLFRHQFHTTPSFLYLTGLSAQLLDWRTLMRCWLTKKSELQLPAHLRLLQPFWTTSSTCCQLPWEDAWTPAITVQVAASATSASSTTTAAARPSIIQCLRRLGLLGGRFAHRPSFALPQGLKTVSLSVTDIRQLQAALVHGVRVLALAAPAASALSPETRSGTDQQTSKRQGYGKEVWRVGGLLRDVAAQDGLPDALRAPKVYHEHPGMADPKTVEAAQIRLRRVKDRLSERNAALAAAASETLSSTGCTRYGPAGHPPGDMRVVYAPSGNQNTALWCVLYLIRDQRRNQNSMACLKRDKSIAALLPSTGELQLDPESMAGLCVLAGIAPALVVSETKCFVYQEADTSAEVPQATEASVFALRLVGTRWQVVVRTSPGVAHEQLPAVDIRNMPACLSSCPPPPANPTQPPLPSATPPTAHNLATRVRVLDIMIRRWDNGLADRDEVAQIHRALFPHASLPRFLEDQRPTAAASETEASSSSSASRVVEYLTDHCGNQYAQMLSSFRRSHAGDEPACAAGWPARSPETASKNNLSVSDLLAILDIQEPQEALAILFLRNRQGNHAEFAASVALWVGALDLCALAWGELLDSGLLECNEDTWLDEAKGLHERWRKEGLARCRCSSCWAQLLYIQSLWGRGGIEVAWDQEISNKAKVPDDILAYTGQQWSAEYGSEVIRQTIREVLATAKERLAVHSFDAFMDNAYEWLVAGSAAGMPSALAGTQVRTELRRLYSIQPRASKRSVMEAIPREHVLAQLRSRPQIVAKLHQKLNETGGKARAIYGVTIWHYIFSNWLMAPFEKAVKHPSIDINLPNHKFLAVQVRRAQQARRGACFSSYDYPDFNAMHSHYHMSIIYEEAAKVATGSAALQDMTAEDRGTVLDGYAWLREAVFTQVCFLPDVDHFIHTVGGLYSGNRDTTLINTLLNIAYAKVVDVSCRAMALDPSVEWRLCHGDDIITLHTNYAAAIGWNEVATEANLKGQEKKLLTDRSFHEYLRVMGCPDGKLRGSLARVVATFVNGNWETDYTPGAFNKVIELQSSIAVLQRRGMRAAFAKKLWSMSVKRLARAVGDAPDEMDLKSAILNLDGGSGLAHPQKLIENGAYPQESAHIWTENILRERYNIEKLFLALPAKVTDPYTKMLIEALPSHLREQEGLHGRLKMMLQKSTYGSELPKKLQIEVKQTPQLNALRGKMEAAVAKRGQFERHISLAQVDRHLSEHKTFATTRRRMKAFHNLLSALDDLGGYTKEQLVAYLCDQREDVVYNVLLTEGMLASDWRRVNRPSGAEVGALENELELLLTGADRLFSDEEVVVYAEDGLYKDVPIRDMMLY